MKLDEILNRAGSFNVITSTDNRFIADFEAGGRTIRFQADHEDEGNWVIGFGEKVLRKGSKEDWWSYDYGKTGHGKEFEVFGTLKAVLNQFIKDADPKGIRFTADTIDGNRASVYAKIFKKNLPAGWKLDINADDGDEDTDPMTFFMMTRK